MPPRSSLARIALIAVLLGLAGCAGSAEPEAPAPRPAADRPAEPAPADALSPSAADLRAAERAQLTGIELGTMWTFENPPLEYWAERYGFNATKEWLDKVRLSSVRYGTYCSASFVSPNGLVMTNHHCARECVEAVSTAETDYVVRGFYAPTLEEERLCPGLFLDQLVSIEDVTARVRSAIPAGADARAVAAAIDATTDRIEAECEEGSELTCQVVPLYHGGQYQLYRYQRYSPVKLVFAPELAAGFFGGDPDNFTYPRYALDVAFVRAYTPDSTAPLRTPNYFTWDATGADDGELVFITGNPGSTSRQITLAQMMYAKAFAHPFLIDYFRAQRRILQDIAAQGPEQAREVRDELFSIENALKKYEGEYAGLMDTLLVGQKIAWEADVRRRIQADPALASRYGDVFERLRDITATKLRTEPIIRILNPSFVVTPNNRGAAELQIAALLIQYVQQTALPESERMPQYRGAQLAQIEESLRTARPESTERQRSTFAFRLTLARDWLGADHPFVRAAFQPGETPEQAAERILRTTQVRDPAFRQSLMQGGTAAVEASQDPVIRLVDIMFDELIPAIQRWQQLSADETVQQERFANALFAVYGTRFPPDATFTLRITDGVVRGYPYNGTMAPPSTSIYGMFGRAADFDNEDPFTLPRTFAERENAIDMSAPLNFVTTNDITGGNSGSPMIDREARVVGIAFDGNIEQLPNEFLFRVETGGRTVGVHSAGITEALRSVYQAEALLNELLRGTAPVRR